MPDESIQYDVNEKNLLDPKATALSGEQVKVLQSIVELRPVKVELQLLLPAGSGKVKTAAGVIDTLNEYRKLIAKGAGPVFEQILKSYEEDKQGKTGCYEAADHALSGLNKYLEKLMEDFRVDLRKAVAKKLDISAKELMTIGRVSARESRLKKGVFTSETAVKAKKEEATGGSDLQAAFRTSKDWQYLGVAFNGKQGRIAVDKRKKFDKTRLADLKELFPEDERRGLTFAAGRLRAQSELTFYIEFLEKAKAKLPSSSDTIAEKHIAKGIKKQIGKSPTYIEVKLKKKFTDDGGGDDAKDDDASKVKAEKDKPKEKEKN
jgi:hypothetical protein